MKYMASYGACQVGSIPKLFFSVIFVKNPESKAKELLWRIVPVGLG